MIEQLTPKQKAKELIDKFRPKVYETRIAEGFKLINVKLQLAKECAQLTVDEILFAYPHTYDLEIEYTRDGDEITVIKNIRGNNEYWQQVKQEIINYQE